MQISKDANLIEDILKPAEVMPTRDGAGKALVEFGEANKNLVVLTADVSESVRTHWFEQKFPNRLFEVGVAEQNLAGVAAGLAATGKIAVIAAYAVFSPGRNWDFIRVAVCYNNVNVKILGSHTGLTVGPDGATHQALEDIAITRVLPNMTVIVPADGKEARKAMLAALAIKSPVYIRVTRDKVPVFTTDLTPFEIGKALLLKEGKDITLIGCGTVVYDCLKAAAELEKEGISAEVINCHTVKPLDAETIINSAKKTDMVMTVEEHQIDGGFGSAVCECLAGSHPCRVKRHGMPNIFGESGDSKDLLRKYKLDANGIAETARKAIGGVKNKQKVTVI